MHVDKPHPSDTNPTSNPISFMWTCYFHLTLLLEVVFYKLQNTGYYLLGCPRNLVNGLSNLLINGVCIGVIINQLMH